MKTIKFIFLFLLLAAVLQSRAFAFGAIAVGDADPKASDASTEQHFTANGLPNYEAAKEVALSQCRAKGLHFCQVALWYDACGAYAKSETNSGNAWAATEDEAKRLAEASCGKDCKVVFAQCERGKQ